MNTERPISEIAESALSTWLSARKKSVSVDEESLYRFAAGLSSEEERNQISERLLRCSADRDRLMEIHRELRRVAEAPLTGRDGLAGWISQRIGESLAKQAGLRGKCLNLPWNAVQEMSTARERIMAIARSISLGNLQPRVAAYRAGSEVQGSLPNGIVVKLSAQISPVGDLNVSAVLENSLDGTQAVPDMDLCLEFVDSNGNAIPIGCAPTRSGAWEMTAEGFGVLTGIDPGALSSTNFRLVVPSNPPDLHQGNRISVSVDGGGATTFELVEEPRLENGSLVVTLGSSAARRQEYAEYSIELAIPLGSHLQVVGAWPMSVWQRDQHTFRTAAIFMGESPLEIGSVLHVGLKLV